MLKHIKESIKDELSGLKKLSGKRLSTFSDIFQVPEDSEIYYNEYNMVILDPELHELISSFTKKKNLIVRIEIPEHNSYMWIYQYFNDQLFDSYLSDKVEEYD